MTSDLPAFSSLCILNQFKKSMRDLVQLLWPDVQCVIIICDIRALSEKRLVKAFWVLNLMRCRFQWGEDELEAPCCVLTHHPFPSCARKIIDGLILTCCWFNSIVAEDLPTISLDLGKGTVVLWDVILGNHTLLPTILPTYTFMVKTISSVPSPTEIKISQGHLEV